MEMTEKKNDLKSMMVESMEKVKEMVDANNIATPPFPGTSRSAAELPVARCGGGYVSSFPFRSQTLRHGGNVCMVPL